MIRVLVLYPRTEGKRFNQEYYLNHHMPLVKEKLSPLKVEVDLGVDSAAGPPPYLAVSHMVFESREQLKAAYEAAVQELLEDKEKFTDIEIVRQVSEVTEI